MPSILIGLRSINSCDGVVCKREDCQVVDELELEGDWPMYIICGSASLNITLSCKRGVAAHALWAQFTVNLHTSQVFSLSNHPVWFLKQPGHLST